MTATSQTEQNALTLPQRAAVALGTAEHEIKLHELAQASCRILAITNADGREEAHRAAMNLRNARTTIEKTGKAAREDATAFSKAVIAEEKRLIAIIEPEEARVLGLRDEWDAKIAAEKAAKIAAERARVEKIQSYIDNIKSAPLRYVSSDSAALEKAIQICAEMTITDEGYAEYTEVAEAARTETLAKLREMHAAAAAAEQAAREAEEVRKAEAARIEAERAELARLRAEQEERDRIAKAEADRIAAVQAAEAKRLADLAAAQDAELRRMREAEAARIRAEEETRAAAAAEAQRKLDAERAEIEEQRAALAREQEESRRRAEYLAQLESDHAEALQMNGQYDIDRETERARLQALADQAAADALERTDDERKAGLPAGSLRAVEVIDEPSDIEIIEQVAVSFDMTSAQALDRLERIAFAELRVAA